MCVRPEVLSLLKSQSCNKSIVYFYSFATLNGGGLKEREGGVDLFFLAVRVEDDQERDRGQRRCLVELDDVYSKGEEKLILNDLSISFLKREGTLA